MGITLHQRVLYVNGSYLTRAKHEELQHVLANAKEQIAAFLAQSPCLFVMRLGTPLSDFASGNTLNSDYRHLGEIVAQAGFKYKVRLCEWPMQGYAIALVGIN